MTEGELIARYYLTGQAVRLRWRDGIIAEISSAADDPASPWIAPGIFDVQVNGYGGIDFQQDNLTVENLLSVAQALREAGCKRFLPTLITAPWPEMIARLRHLRKLRSSSAELQSAIAGWHVEGPFLSTEPGYHGAHDPALMLDPTPERIRELRDAAGNDPLLLTLSPERPGAIEAIKQAVALSIKISLGHTNATQRQLLDAVNAGATGFTHLGNGCPRELDRHDNILWRVLETPGLICGLIPDGIHVSPPLMRLLYRCLGPEKIYFTTDAMAAAGSAPGAYTLGSLRLEVGADQIVRQPGKTNFAGSALRPCDGVVRAANILNLPWQKIWDCFSTNPARLMQLQNGLESGQPADFCLIKTDDSNRIREIKASGIWQSKPG